MSDAKGNIRKRATNAVKTRQEGSVTVSRAFYNMGEMYSEEESTDTVSVPIFSNPAHVKVSGSVTKNIGNYESVKVAVEVTLPCHAEGSEIEKAYDIASTFVNHKIQDEVEFAYGRENKHVNS